MQKQKYSHIHLETSFNNGLAIEISKGFGAENENSQ
jgi:hypothetical protein